MPNNDAWLVLAGDLERKRAGLMAAGDAEGLSELLSDDLYFAHSSGLRDDKASYLRQFQAGAFVYHAIEPTVEAATPIGERGFMATGTLAVHVTVDGVEKHVRLIALVVWRQEAGRWRLLANQTTAAPAFRAL